MTPSNVERYVANRRGRWHLDRRPVRPNMMRTSKVYFPLGGGATTYCVRQGAGGANNGSDWTNAFTAFPANGLFARGDTFYIADSVTAYAKVNFDKAESGTTLITVKKAIETDHGPAGGWLSQYGDGTAAFNNGATFATWDFSSGYWFIDGQRGGGPGNWKGGTTPYGFKLNATGSSDGHHADLGSATNITIKHFETVGNGGTPTAFHNDFGGGGCQNVLLSYCYLHDHGDCIFRWKLGCGDIRVEFAFTGYYGDTNPFGTHTELQVFDTDGGGTAGDVTYVNCIFTYIQSTGGLMWDNHSNTAAQQKAIGCIFYPDPLLVPWVEGGNGLIAGFNSGADIFNNTRTYYCTFISTGERIFFATSGNPGNNRAGNNFFFDCTDIVYDQIDVHDYSHYVNSGGTHGEANSTSQGAAALATIFNDPTNFDFGLRTNTAAGQSLGAPYDGAAGERDMNGNLRTFRTRGAVEFGSVAPPPVVYAFLRR